MASVKGGAMCSRRGHIGSQSGYPLFFPVEAGKKDFSQRARGAAPGAM